MSVALLLMLPRVAEVADSSMDRDADAGVGVDMGKDAELLGRGRVGVEGGPAPQISAAATVAPELLGP